jgi:hypothetical protein
MANSEDRNKMNSQDPRAKADAESQRQRQAQQQADEARPGRGINQPGFIKDKETGTSDSYGDTRDAGETGGSK